MTQWEYRIVRAYSLEVWTSSAELAADEKLATKQLNDLASDGWEIMWVTDRKIVLRRENP